MLGKDVLGLYPLRGKTAPWANTSHLQLWAATMQDFDSQVRISKAQGLCNELTKLPSPNIYQFVTLLFLKRKNTWSQDNQSCTFPSFRSLSGGERDNCQPIGSNHSAVALGSTQAECEWPGLKCSLPICSKSPTCWETWPLARGRAQLPLALAANKTRLITKSSASWYPADGILQATRFLKILDFHTQKNLFGFLLQVDDIFDGAG